MTHLFMIPYEPFTVFVRRVDGDEIDYDVRDKETGVLIGAPIIKDKVVEFSSVVRVGVLSINKKEFNHLRKLLSA